MRYSTLSNKKKRTIEKSVIKINKEEKKKKENDDKSEKKLI